ncbi:MAG: MliC family protein [Hyphomicrobiaceae bacterium]
MRSLFIALGLLLPAGHALAEPLTFICDDGQELGADVSATGSATVTRGETRWTLPATASDSGTTYVADNVEFWTEGTEAILTVDGVTTQCILRPAPE